VLEISYPFHSVNLEHIVKPEYYVRFVLDSTDEMLFELTYAANYLNIQPMFDLTCLAVSFYIQDKSPEEVEKLFHNSDDAGGSPGARESV
jgi:hypothetical protein